MFIGTRELTDDAVLEADVCVVGSGPAGLAVAHGFLARRERVIVLEAGGERPSWRSQGLYRAEVTGAPNHAATHSRFRAYGGSGTRWTGQCVPLEAIDFERREALPESGWPFDLEHLRPWYRRAAALLGLGAGTDACEREAVPLLGGDSRLAATTIRFARPIDIGASLRAAFAASDNVDVVLETSVVDLVTDATGRRLDAVRCRAAGGTRRLEVRARRFVLAAGGIENPRLLLASTSRGGAGLGNEHDLVGRYFHDHPYLTGAYWRPSARASADGTASGALVIEDFAALARGRGAHAALTLDPALRRREGLAGCVGYFVHREPWQLERAYHAPGGRAVVHLAELLRGERVPDLDIGASLRDLARDPRAAATTLAGPLRTRLEHRAPRLALRTVLEATPRADSRVTLERERDAHGLPRARVDWRVSGDDWRGEARLCEELARVIGSRGLGTLVDDPGTDADGWPHSMNGGKHHMGTTRMHADPTRGVVDADARVHGLENLHVAGSSVFPSGGWANPTLTIAALSIRLADHLITKLS